MAIIVKGGGGKPEEEKTVTAGTSVIEVNPSSGKVMKKVTVNSTPTESKEVTAGTSDTTVSPTEGKHLSGVTVHPTPSQEKTVIPTADGFKVSPETGKLLSAVFVDGDSDLVAENIKQGVNIFGVDGTFDNSHGAYVWKKYENKPEIIIGTASVVSNGIQITIPDSTGITEEYLDGAKFTTNLSLFATFTLSYSNGAKTATCEDSTYNGTYSYINGVLTIINSSLASLPEIGASNLTFEKTFLDFTVSDSPTAYPDGGEQGGYWYEKVVLLENGIFFNAINESGRPTDITIKSTKGSSDILGGPGYISVLENVLINMPEIVDSCFSSTFRAFKVKIKIKNATNIGKYAFAYIGGANSTTYAKNIKLYIPATCTTIYGNSNDQTGCPFYNRVGPINIYCEASSKPSGWGDYWNIAGGGYGFHTTMWGVTESSFDVL